MKLRNLASPIAFLVFMISSMSISLAEKATTYCVDNNTEGINLSVSNSSVPITLACTFGCNSITQECNENPYVMQETGFISFLAIFFFLGNLGVMLAKIFNASKLGTWYSRTIIFITFIFSLLSWLIILGFALFNNTLQNVFYLQISTFLMGINSFLTIIELFVGWYGEYVKKLPKIREHKFPIRM